MTRKRLIIITSAFILSGIVAYFVAHSMTDKSDFTSQSPAESQDSISHSTAESEGITQKSEPDSTEVDSHSVDDQTPLSETLPETPYLISSNCTTTLGPLMLINPNFLVDDSFIALRRSQLIDLTATYGIQESNYWNGTPLLDSEAAEHLHAMIIDYEQAYPGHTMNTLSCFRSVGTSCGRLCVATGGSDHHSGYTCDLHDPAYGGELNTDLLAYHPEWQWLHDNSYRYGFIDRFIPEWAGGTMDEPANIDATGTTGLHETWHYRYVGVSAATDIATGKYNGGAYDSLEHYLLQRGIVTDLLDPTSCAF